MLILATRNVYNVIASQKHQPLGISSKTCEPIISLRRRNAPQNQMRRGVSSIEPELPPYFSQFYVFIIFSQDFQYAFFFAYKVSSRIDAWHIFKSSYDETIKKLLVSSYELLNICQASIIDFTLLCKKHISKVFTF